MTTAPMLHTLNDVFGGEYLGFYWHGIPYKLPEPCSEEVFIYFWNTGWNQRRSGGESYAKYYKEPACTIYSFAYGVAPSKVATAHTQAIIEAAKNRFSSQPELEDIPF